MKKSSLFSLGAVTLNVRNFNLMKEFYRNVLDLDIIDESDNDVVFANTNRPILTIRHTENLPIADPSHAGLYHFAILFSSRSDLSGVIRHIIKTSPELFVGSADHLVSEAFYFSDPEGNGIELYFDRDPALWEWEDGQVKMGSVYLDPGTYIQRNSTAEKKQSNRRLGHMHLKVGDLTKAKEFYSDTLGFMVTAVVPGAVFVSMEGYHHHIGLNIWESHGTGERSDSLGLHSFELLYSDRTILDELRMRLEKNGISITGDARSFSFDDPWKNRITARIKTTV